MNRFFPPFALYAGSEVVIGRAVECSLNLQHNAISRRHATIRCGADALVLNDLGSANGTLVNGKKIAGSTKLAAGDVIDLGPYRIAVRPPSAGPTDEGAPAAKDPKEQLRANQSEISGAIGSLDLTELLRVVELHRKTGTLVVESPDGRGRLIIVNGKPTNARFGGQFDEAAVLAMARVRSGKFHFRSRVDEKVETTMTSTLSQLIVELARKEDEARRSQDRKVAAEAQTFFGDLSALLQTDDGSDFGGGGQTAVFQRTTTCPTCGTRGPLSRACPGCGAPRR
jgi:pSer/pThr/pTyr-binding forkhead associated (FHA) protein